MNTNTPKHPENLIASLADDLTPVRKPVHPALLSLIWCVVSVLTTGVLVSLYGLRYNLNLKIQSPLFQLDLIFAAATAVTAAMAVFYLRYPDMRGVKWIIALPVLLSALMLCTALYKGFIAEGLLVHPLLPNDCFINSLGLMVMPVFLLVLLAARGRTTRPVTQIVLAALGASAAGWLGMRFACPVDTVLHAYLYHFAPFVPMAVLLGIAARKILRW